MSKSALPCTGNQEWNTPARIIEAARRVMGGIDCDPASNDTAQQTVQAGTYYTRETNGLAREWAGRVWLNPPYSSALLTAFIRHLYGEIWAQRTTEAIVLVNNATDGRAIQQLVAGSAAFCLIKGRLRFGGAVNGPPLQGQLLVYHGPHRAAFLGVFSRFGTCAIPAVVVEPDLFRTSLEEKNHE